MVLPVSCLDAGKFFCIYQRTSTLSPGSWLELVWMRVNSFSIYQRTVKPKPCVLPGSCPDLGKFFCIYQLDVKPQPWVLQGSCLDAGKFSVFTSGTSSISPDSCLVLVWMQTNSSVSTSWMSSLSPGSFLVLVWMQEIFLYLPVNVKLKPLVLLGSCLDAVKFFCIYQQDVKPQP